MENLLGLCVFGGLGKQKMQTYLKVGNVLLELCEVTTKGKDRIGMSSPWK